MNSQWLTSLSYRRRGWWRGFVGSSWSRVTVIVAAVCLAAFLCPAAAAFFLFVYVRLETMTASAAGAVALALEPVLLVSFLVTAIGAFLAAVRAFGRPEPNLVAAWPWRMDARLSERLLLVLWRSAWPTLLIAWPALAAAGRRLDGTWSYQLFAVATASLLLLAGTGCGLAVRFLMSASRRRPSPWLMRIVGAIALTVSVLFVFWSSLQAVGGVGPQPPLEMLRWPFRDLAGVASGLTPSGIITLVNLVGWGVATGCAWLTALWLASRFDQSWLWSEEPTPLPVRHGGFRLWKRFAAPRHVFLFEREWLNLSRDGDALARLLSLALLIVAAWSVLFSALPLLEVVGPVARAEVSAWAVFSLGAAALVAGLDRCFPSLAVESSEIWLTRTSPMHLHELYSWKFFFWSTLLGIGAVLPAIVSSLWLELPLPLVVALPAMAVGTVMTMVALTLGQGFVFCPAASSGRLALTGGRRHRPIDVPAAWAAVIVGIAYLAVTWSYVRRLVGWHLVTGEMDGRSILGWLTVSVTVIIVYWWLAPHRLEREEGCRS